MTLTVRYRVRASDEIGAETHPFAFECPNYLCFWITAHATVEDALEAIAIHDRRCPMTGETKIYIEGEKDENGQPYTKPVIGKSIAERFWDMLDDAVENVIKHPSDAYKARGRAFAEVVFEVCKPFYATVDDVTRESVRRWKQKNGQVEFASTPGYKYNPMPPNKYEAMVARKKEEQKEIDASARTSSLSEDQKAAITNGLKMGFAVEQLSKAYNVAPSVIESLR